MQKQIWKRFRPKIRGDLRDRTIYEERSLYSDARLVVDDMMRRSRSGKLRFKGTVARSTAAAKLLRQHDTHDSIHLLALLILQSPGAAQAQRDMDQHHGGYKNREARLFELIDFNDTFVDTVLSLPSHELSEFSNRLRNEIDAFCQKLHVAPFDDKQFDAITHGLSREIAVYRGAKTEGYIVRMTSRVQDAKGVDMIITDPVSKKSIGVDVKTRSSFHFRLLDLQRRKRIDEQRRMECELAGFCKLPGLTKYEETVLLRIATDRLGEIVNFGFLDTKPLAQLLKSAISIDGKYYR